MSINKLKQMVLVFVLTDLLVISTSVAMAQAVTGRLLGTVQDSTEAGVPAALVTITNENTGIGLTVQTDSAGNYIAPTLQAGTYTVKVAVTGFQTVVSRGNVVNVAQTTRVDVTLTVGQVSQSMEVRAIAPLVQSTTSDVGETIQQRQVETLPLNGRIFSQLMQLTPGSVPSGQTGTETESSAGAGSRTPISASVNGISNSGNSYTIDGVLNSEPGNGYVSIAPPIEAVEEFKVQTSNPGAEFGVFGGAVVNLTIRSGTNQFHGSLFEYLRNDKLNARPFFSATKAAWRTNQFGGTVGGPIRRNKFFFFADYQGLRLREGKTYNLNVPTAAMQQGILLPAEGFDIAYDPDSSSTPANRTPFAGNTIAANRWDAVTRKVLGLWPQPNQSGTRPGPYQNFGINASDAQTMNNGDIKVDYQFERIGRVFVRESYSRRDLDVATVYNRFLSASPDSDARNHNAVLGFSTPIGTTLVNEIRVGYNRFSTFHFGQDYPVMENNILGIRNGNLSDDPQTWGIAGFSAALSGFGAPSWTNALRKADSMQLTNGTTWILGSHTVKFGFNLWRFRTTNTNPAGSPRGGFTFGRDMTSLNGRGGAEFAGFLLGYPSSVSRSFVRTRPDVRVLQGGPYVQDDWRVSRSLTLNVGLRWDILTTPVENYNRQTNFNLTTGKFDKAVPGNRAPNVDSYLGNFGPRVGLAYSPNQGRTAVRTAFGISYWNNNTPGINVFLERNFPLFQTFSLGPTLSYVPFLKVDADGLPDFVPTPITEHIDPIAGISPLSMPRDYRPAMIMSWNAGIQQRLGETGVGEIAYVATRGTHLDRQRAINTPRYAGPGPLNDRRPYYSLSPLTQSIGLRDSGVNSTYNSLQLKYSRRFASGFQGLFSYTWARSYDDASTLWVWDDSMNWGPSSGQPRHVIASSWTWELPIGKGRKYMGSAPTALQQIAGGWSINGIAMLRTGTPLSVAVQNNLLNTGTSNVADKVCSDVRYPKLLSQWFDTSCFADPTAPYVWGNATRGALWGPGVVNFDLSAFKGFALGEQRSIQFRAEFFNAFNNPHFSNPDTSRASGNFGRITSTALPPREVQLGVKFAF